MPMTKREAERLIAEHGGSFVRHGGRHDFWVSADGKPIPVPRHPGDFTPGVERSIKKALGVK